MNPIFSLLVFLTLGFFHEGLHEKILKTTREIQLEPDEPQLWIARADLYRLHKDWDHAFADLDRAREISPNLTRVEIVRGQTYFDLGWFVAAHRSFDYAISMEPKNGAAFLLRSRVLLKRNAPEDALSDLSTAISLIQNPPPQLYIDRSNLLVSFGEDSLPDALRGIQEGLQRLGAALSLELEAVKLETRLGHFDAALSRLKKIESRSPRKDGWLSWQGDVLQKAGRDDEAKIVFRRCLLAIDNLHPKHRNTPKTRELRSHVLTSLDQINSLPRSTDHEGREK